MVVENASPLPENASEHSRVAVVTVSASPRTALVGEPVIINASPAVHPFVLSRRSARQWEVSSRRHGTGGLPPQSVSGTVMDTHSPGPR